MVRFEHNDFFLKNTLLRIGYTLYKTIVLFFIFTDIVFFIFLYQRWIYKVDKSRINEFGFSAEMEDNMNGAANGTICEQPEDPSQHLKRD